MAIFLFVFIGLVGIGVWLGLLTLMLGTVVGIAGLIVYLFTLYFQSIFSVMAIIGILVLAVIGYFYPALLVPVSLITVIIWQYPEPEGENRKDGIPFVSLFNLFVVPLFICFFYQIAEFDGLISTLFGLLSALAFDVLLAVKRPTLVDRNINFLWLWSI